MLSSHTDDYCNALNVGQAMKVTQKIQLVQNITVCISIPVHPDATMYLFCRIFTGFQLVYLNVYHQHTSHLADSMHIYSEVSLIKVSGQYFLACMHKNRTLRDTKI